ncbi:MAG TPA: hypothetical protein VE244_04285 [Nitrososphaeraceae archaeon]|jgi:hypothetical protein|nr:hypothetical protein [Nitrososphaeraceae archaeon]
MVFKRDLSFIIAILLIKMKMYVVKRLGKNGTWNTITLIDKNGSFRGEARFESEKEAFNYLEEYKKRMKSPQELKVFPEP